MIVGLGVRAVRAGSIGRDGQRLGKITEPPRLEAGGLGPCSLREEIIASCFQADRPAPLTRLPLGFYPVVIRSGWSPVTEGVLALFLCS